MKALSFYVLRFLCQAKTEGHRRIGKTAEPKARRGKGRESMLDSALDPNLF
jgi:hypothetical protein